MKGLILSQLHHAKLTLAILLCPIAGAAATNRPNILWIIGEDASPHIGCYGETLIKTPRLDQMANNGIRFSQAFVTAPVCSPCRSAMITGIYQTTLGAQNHRSQQTARKGGGNTAYYDSYELPETVKLVPELFKEAGYFTTLGQGPDCRKLGKTDYNFIFDPAVYDGADWRLCPPDRPFFAQIMLSGGKDWQRVQRRTDPGRVQLPPYYPNHPVLRKRWAAYLDSWTKQDREVGRILDDLEKAGVAENTIVFFWTDHGLAQARAKQFLYDEGMRIPLLVRFGDGRLKGTVRDDLILQIDVAATSLALAEISATDNMHGRNVFQANYTPRSMIVSARDRCDETVDIIRCIRTNRFKYIRNFMSYRSHTQPNESKDDEDFLLTIRALHVSGKLTELQSRILAPTRPVEELYDLQSDPFETVNLANRPEFRNTLDDLRNRLYSWMKDTGDTGLIPEPILEDMGRTYDNKYFILKQQRHRNLIGNLINLIEAGEQGRTDLLHNALKSSDPSHRYWAATWLGINGSANSMRLLEERLNDRVPAVRIATARSLYQLGSSQNTVQIIADEIGDYNLINGLFAIRALEWIGDHSAPERQRIREAQNHPYEYVRRIANRLSTTDISQKTD